MSVTPKEEIERQLSEMEIVGFAKCGRTDSYVRALYERGIVYCNALGSYRRAELPDGTRDPYEGSACSFMQCASNAPIFCMTALRKEDILPDGTPIIGSRMRDEFVGESGAVCVISDPVEFLSRIEDKEGRPVVFSSIWYVGDMFGDPLDAFNHLPLVPFMKNSRFSYQREFRIKLPRRCERIMDERERDLFTGKWKPEIADVGPIEDIARCFPAEGLPPADRYDLAG